MYDCVSMFSVIDKGRHVFVKNNIRKSLVHKCMRIEFHVSQSKW